MKFQLAIAATLLSFAGSLLACAESTGSVDKALSAIQVTFDDPLPVGAISRIGTTRLRCQEKVLTIAVTSGGEFIATSGRLPDSAIRVWDTKSGEERFNIDNEDYFVAISPDDSILATTGKHNDLGIRLWDMQSKKQIREIKLGDIKTRTGYTGPSAHGLGEVAFSPDGEILAVEGWLEREEGHPDYQRYRFLHLVNFKTGKEVNYFSPRDNPGHGELKFRFAHDGKAIVVIAGRDATIYLLETSTLHVQRTLGDHAQDMAFSANGRYLAIADHEKIRILDCKTWDEVRSFPVDSKVRGAGPGPIALSPDGKLLAAGGGYADPVAHIWDTTTGNLEREIPRYYAGSATSLEFTADGKQLVCGSEKLVHIWDVPQGTENVLGNVPRGRLHSMAFSPDGKLIALCGDDSGVRIHDADTHELLHWFGRDEFAWRVAFSPDSQLLASVGHSLRLWKTATGQKIWSRGPEKRIRKGDPTAPTSVIFLPGGNRLITGSYDGDLRVWEAKTGVHLKSYSLPPASNGELQIYGLGLTPVANLLVTYGGVVRLWDLKAEKLLSTHNGMPYNHDAGTPIAVTPNGLTIAYEAYLGFEGPTTRQGIVLHDVLSEEPPQLLLGQEQQNYREQISVAFSPTQPLLAAGGTDRMVCLWNTNTRQEIARLEGHTDFISAIAFSPNGKTLASASWDGTVLFWDVNEFVDTGIESETE